MFNIVSILIGLFALLCAIPAFIPLLGALNWIGHWYKPDGELSPDQIAGDFAARLTDGLAEQPNKKKAAKAIRKK